jgi:D-glycero-D-manno-heptose 1,7-bisphosphate phosphatase
MIAMSKTGVFLDRDGVLNRAIVRDGKPYPPRKPDEVEVLPGAAEACRRFSAAGYVLVLVTNQPDIARGVTPRDWVDRVNNHLQNALGLDLAMVCPHDESDRCKCRKPAPGMILEAASRMDIDLSRSFMVGDRWRDIEAGRNAGCRTIWIQSDYDERPGADADRSCATLLDAAEWVLGRPANGETEKES